MYISVMVTWKGHLEQYGICLYMDQLIKIQTWTNLYSILSQKLALTWTEKLICFIVISSLFKIFDLFFYFICFSIPLISSWVQKQNHILGHVPSSVFTIYYKLPFSEIVVLNHAMVITFMCERMINSFCWSHFLIWAETEYKKPSL